MEIKIPKKFLASNVSALVKQAYELSDAELESYAFITSDQFHFHGGQSTAIAWNDVQEVNMINEYTGVLHKVLVPSYPTEGYNQHSHTSEYDGGVLAGVSGTHAHHNNRSGGYAFAILYPATGIPLSDWEE